MKIMACSPKLHISHQYKIAKDEVSVEYEVIIQPFIYL